MYDEAAGEPWHRRLIIRSGQWAQRLRKRAKPIVVGLLALYVLYCLASYVLGYTGVDRQLIEASEHYTSDPYNTTLYRWQSGVGDDSVSPHVVAARANLSNAHLLALVATTADNDAPGTLVRCADFVSRHNEPLLDMMRDAELYLRTNPDVPCVCGQQLEYAYRYLALRQRQASDEVRELLDDAQPSVSVVDDVAVVHAFNPVDEHQREYDELDGPFFQLRRINLTVVDEHQDERYNARRGTFSLIRRTSVRLMVSDRECHRERISLFNDMALCAQRCLDLMRGIDVRQRARLQLDKGVALNTALFEPPSSPPPPPPPARQSADHHSEL
jgi:hypothetical protein